MSSLIVPGRSVVADRAHESTGGRVGKIKIAVGEGWQAKGRRRAKSERASKTEGKQLENEQMVRLELARTAVTRVSPSVCVRRAC